MWSEISQYLTISFAFFCMLVQGEDISIADSEALRSTFTDRLQSSTLVGLVIFISESFKYYISHVVYGIVIVLNTVCSIFTWLVYFIFGTIDLVLRGPVFILKWCLQLITFVLEFVLYLTGEGKILSMEKLITVLPNVILSTVILALETAGLVAELLVDIISTALLFCLLLVDLLVYNILFPVVDAVFWTGVVVLLMVILFIILSNFLNVTVMGNTQIFKNPCMCVVLIPLLYLAIDMCKVILNCLLVYVIHPVIYTAVICLLSIVIYIITKFLQALYRILSKAVINKTLGHVQIFLSKLYKSKDYFETSQEINTVANKSERVSECVICFEETDYFMVILPCYHSAFCAACLEQISRLDGRCPLCRALIQDIQAPL